MEAKRVLGLLMALVPVLYCGGLLYYFLDVAGSVDTAAEIGLGPTLLGLGVVGLFFCIPLVVKAVRLFSAPPSQGPGASKPGGSTGPKAPAGDDKSENEEAFDADAAIARYMARQAQATAGSTPSTRDGGAAKPSGFGQRHN